MSSSQDAILLTTFEETLTQSALSPSTIVNYLADVHAFLRWSQQEISSKFSLLQTNPEHIRLYRHHLVQNLQRAPSTVNRHLMALRKFFTFASELGAMPADPTAGISLVQSNGQVAAKPLTNNEIERLLQAAEKGARIGLARRDAAILQLLLHTGLRVSEIIDLKKDDLIFDHPGVRLRVCGTHHKTRHIPLSGKICKALTDYLQVRPQSANAEQFFLNQEGRPVSKRTVQRIISENAKAANLQGVTAQSIRRTFALQLLSETEDLALVSKRLGHQSTTITEQYLSGHKNQ